jgi:hypothetical protein
MTVALDVKVLDAIDHARRRGLNYDQVVAAVQHHGVPAHEVEGVIAEYRNVVDEKGRRREQVNLGDPAERFDA